MEQRNKMKNVMLTADTHRKLAQLKAARDFRNFDTAVRWLITQEKP